MWATCGSVGAPGITGEPLLGGLDLPVLGFKTTALVGSLQAAHDLLTRRRISEPL
jgi:hypothetical protein